MTRKRAVYGNGHRTFLLTQLVLVVLLCGVGVAHLRTDRTGNRIPRFRIQPRVVASRVNEPAAITDAQLGEVLHRLRPRLNQSEPKVNFVDHALRMWGDKVVFDDPECMSGSDMRAMLIDHKSFQKRWGIKERPLLIQDARGVGWRTQQGKASISHVDHTLATLAEIGIPADTRIRTAVSEATVGDLLTTAIGRFQLNQAEYEWSVLACALYADEIEDWVTPEGQRLNLDRVVDRMMREAPNKGVCYGNHRLFTLAALLQIDEDTHWMTPAGRATVVDYLGEMTGRLISSQHIEGYWDSNWPSLAEAVDDKQEPLSRRLLATGHALEWWAVAPEQVRPPRETVIRAAQWLVRKVESLEDADIKSNYTFLTHVGRALALWRGGDVAELYLHHHPQARETKKEPNGILEGESTDG